MEIPIATWRVFNQNVPVGGGAYLRILPYALMKYGIHAVNKNETAPVGAVHASLGDRRFPAPLGSVVEIADAPIHRPAPG